MKKKIKIAYIINHLSFFESHMIPLADEARNSKFDIFIFCGTGGSKIMETKALKIIRRKGFKFKRFGFSPGIGNIFVEIVNIFKMISYIKKFNPDIIHGITLKGILLSCIYSSLFRPKKLICFITGMGYFFTNKLNIIEKIFKFFILRFIIYFLSKKNSKLVLENNDDFNFFVKKKNLKKKQILKLKGVGVDLKKFKYEEINKRNIVLFPARVLREKGILEFYSAAKKLSSKYKNWKFLIAGTTDYEKNNYYLNKRFLKNTKSIRFLGHVNNVDKLFNKSSIVCLPSYREGFPKSLIEASSSGCAIVTTDVPGCREVVKKNVNALFCRPKDHIMLKKMIEKLIINVKIRRKFSKNSRKIAIKNYNLNIFIKKNIKEYQGIKI